MPRRRPARPLTHLAAACAAALTFLLGGAASASAGTYVVNACQLPDGSAAPMDGWLYEAVGTSGQSSADRCSTGDGASVWLDPAATHPADSYAAMRFEAPVETRIVRVTGHREQRVGASDGLAVPTVRVDTNLGNVARCSSSSCSTSSSITWDIAGASWLRLTAACYGGDPCAPQDPKAHITVRTFGLTLEDAAAPNAQVTGGDLVEAAVRQGRQTAQIHATDLGGGIKDAAVIVDDSAGVRQVLDTNGGKCAAPYAYRVPCKLDVTGTVSLDTTGFTDGTHQLQIVVRDVADNERVAFGPQAVVFDNRPPTMATPTVTGVAREGEVLACSPQAVDGQSPTISYQWARGAADGSGMTAIAGATAATYTLQRADVDGTLQCTITARDRGGATSRQSDLAQGPFAGGATVEPAKGDTSAGGGAAGGGTPASGSGAPGDRTPLLPGGSTTGARIHALFAASNGRVVRTPHGRRVTVRGRVEDLNGAPVGGGLIDVVARPEPGGGPEREVARIRTRPDGTFAALLKGGLPSAELVLRYRRTAEAPALAATTLDLRVAAGLALRVTPRVRARGVIRFTGRLLTGPVPRRGKVVELRARGAGGRWIVFRTVRTDRRGAFRARYRLKRGFRNVTYLFQAVTRAENGYPYDAGVSPTRRTRVR